MPWSASRRPNSESHAPGKVDVQANWPLLRRSAGVRRYWLTWPNVVTGMPWRVPLWEKEFPGRKLGENREASYQQRSRSKSGHVSSLCGAGADYALRPSTAFVEQLLQHESFHIESITVADAPEGHFTQCKGAAIAAAGLSQEWRQVECQLQGNQQSSQGLALIWLVHNLQSARRWMLSGGRVSQRPRPMVPDSRWLGSISGPAASSLERVAGS